MPGPAWPLVVFTLFSQTAVGAFLAMAVVRFLGTGRSEPAGGGAYAPTLRALASVLGLATLVGFTHLGDPLKAIYALGNLGSSWLSREIFFAASFIALLLALSEFERRRTARWIGPISLLTALVGLAFVVSMSKVYMLPTIPVWNGVATMVSFFITTLLLGGLAFLAVAAPPDGGLYRITTILASVLVLLDIGSQLVVVRNLGPPTAAGLRFVLTTKAILLVAALASMGAHRFRGRTAPGGFLYAAFALVLLAEGLGRYLFYAVYGRVGI